MFLHSFVYAEATDLLQKLSLDTQPKALEIPEPTKKVRILVFKCPSIGFLIECFHNISIACEILPKHQLEII